MLKRELGAEINGKLPHLFFPSKTATLVPEFAVEDLPLGTTAALAEFAVKHYLLRSVQMLKREWGAEINGKLPHLFFPSKTATLVPEFAVEDLPLGTTAAFAEFAVKKCLLRSVQMLKRKWGAEINGKLPHVFFSSKTATLVPEFAVEDLPLGTTAALAEFAVKNCLYDLFRC